MALQAVRTRVALEPDAPNRRSRRCAPGVPVVAPYELKHPKARCDSLSADSDG